MIESYRDPELVPPDINESGDLTPAECLHECVHGGACARALEQVGRDAEDADVAAKVLACDWCEYFDDEYVLKSQRLKEMCAHLVEVIRVGEGVAGVGLLSAWDRDKLAALGIDVRHD